MQQTARLAGFFAAHGIWSVADGATLIPMIGYEQAGGERKMVRFANEDIAVLIEAFFAGVDSHERAASIWNASLDESI